MLGHVLPLPLIATPLQSVTHHWPHFPPLQVIAASQQLDPQCATLLGIRHHCAPVARYCFPLLCTLSFTSYTQPKNHFTDAHRTRWLPISQYWLFRMTRPTATAMLLPLLPAHLLFHYRHQYYHHRIPFANMPSACPPP